MTAFPLHLWAFLHFFADFAWISERTNTWDAVAVGSYGLLAALVESLFVFTIFWLLGALVSGKWGLETRLLLLATFATTTSLWAMWGQYYFYAGVEIPAWVYSLALAFPRPLWALLVVFGTGVAVTLVVPAWFILRSGRVRSALGSVYDRIGTLMAVYLVVDLAALVVAAVRNF